MKTCEQCGKPEVFARNLCRACHQRSWRKRNPDDNARIQREWYARHREEVLRRRRAEWKKDPLTSLAYGSLARCRRIGRPGAATTLSGSSIALTGGIVSIGSPGSPTGPAAGEVLLGNGKLLRETNNAGTGTNYWGWRTDDIHKTTAVTASTVGAAGGASALPATPTAYWRIEINGTIYKVPFYAD